MKRKIYLDFNESTPIPTEAVDEMRPFLFDHYGNPSSLHDLPSFDRSGMR